MNLISKLSKRKKANIYQLKVGLRTQLCKECKDLQRRICEVDGETCVFHRFVDEDRALLHINCMLRDEECREINHRFRRDYIVPPMTSPEIVRNTYALVEFPDGTLKKVEPDKIRFLDKGE